MLAASIAIKGAGKPNVKGRTSTDGGPTTPNPPSDRKDGIAKRPDEDVILKPSPLECRRNSPPRLGLAVGGDKVRDSNSKVLKATFANESLGVNNDEAPAIFEQGASDITTNLVPLTGYDANFLSDCKHIIISDLLERRNIDDNDGIPPGLKSTYDDSSPNGEFMLCTILTITKPSGQAQEDYFKYPKHVRGGRKRVVSSTSYKHKITLGDIGDPAAHTCAILEENSDRHNLLFSWDKSLSRVRVGASVAILVSYHKGMYFWTTYNTNCWSWWWQSPQLEGIMKSGTYVISTDWPLQLVQCQNMPQRPLDCDCIGSTQKFFSPRGM